MDEIIKLIVAKTGMSESMAKTAAETVFTYVKAKLPAGQHYIIRNQTQKKPVRRLFLYKAADFKYRIGYFCLKLNQFGII